MASVIWNMLTCFLLLVVFRNVRKQRAYKIPWKKPWNHIFCMRTFQAITDSNVWVVIIVAIQQKCICYFINLCSDVFLILTNLKSPHYINAIRCRNASYVIWLHVLLKPALLSCINKKINCCFPYLFHLAIK